MSTNEKENPAVEEIFEVECNVVYTDECQPRQTYRYQYQGLQPQPQQVMAELLRQHPELTAQDCPLERVHYSVSRLMNNDVHIALDSGNFDPRQMNTPAGEPVNWNNPEGTSPNYVGQ